MIIGNIEVATSVRVQAKTIESMGYNQSKRVYAYFDHREQAEGTISEINADYDQRGH